MSGGRPVTPLIDRFNDKYIIDEETGCWEWTAAKNRQGYGTIQLFVNIKGLAPRVSYELLVGPIPEKLCVCHHCDNPGCVNPEHLFLGTRRDNNLDMMKKGRHVAKHGIEHGRCKLSEKDCTYIRENYKPYQCTAQSLADKFGVARRTIWNIANYKSRQTGVKGIDI